MEFLAVEVYSNEGYPAYDEYQHPLDIANKLVDLNQGLAVFDHPICHATLYADFSSLGLVVMLACLCSLIRQHIPVLVVVMLYWEHSGVVCQLKRCQ